MLRGVGYLFAVSALCAPQPCASCHPHETDRHARTNHARTLRPASATEFASAMPAGPIGEARGGFLLSYSASADGRGLLVHAERGKDVADGRMEWVLGAGDQGITPLVTFAGKWLEHRISYYTRPARFDLTLGHAPGASRSAAAALGIVQPAATVQACLNCHGKTSSGELRIVEAGVGCDRCHIGASEHALGRGPVTTPAKLPALQQVRLCAECHRLEPAEGTEHPLNVRFQPLRLVKSRCFAKGGAACLMCHVGHQNAVRSDPAYYRSKCRTCHDSGHSREQFDCLPCHMPKSSPAPYLQFTDHFIRIVRGKGR